MTNSPSIPLFFRLLLVVVPWSAAAQEGVNVQYEPAFSYTRSLSNRWSSNMQVTVRNTFLRPSSEGSETGAAYQMNFVELQLFGTYQLWNDTKLSLGYKARGIEPLEPPLSSEHRPMEQIAFIGYKGSSRLSHRIRTEQRFRPDRYENRWRYRFSYDRPLEGQRLDPGEMYLVLSDEVLYTFNAVERSAENRLYAGLGWLFLKSQKLETGVQYRLGEIGTVGLEHILWLTTTYYISQ